MLILNGRYRTTCREPASLPHESIFMHVEDDATLSIHFTFSVVNNVLSLCFYLSIHTPLETACQEQNSLAIVI